MTLGSYGYKKKGKHINLYETNVYIDMLIFVNINVYLTPDVNIYYANMYFNKGI